jgi:hypothetical protein
MILKNKIKNIEKKNKFDYFVVEERERDVINI